MKKVGYVSLSMAEIAILIDHASHPEVTLYLILKKLANFQTGVVGTFGQQKLSLRRLGEQLERNPEQGVAGITYDDTQVRRLLDKLARRGIVADIKFTDRLTLRLPLSPMHEVEAVNDEPVEKPRKLSEAKRAKAHSSQSESPVFSEPPSVLTPFTKSQYDQSLNTDSEEADDVDVEDLFAGRKSIQQIRESNPRLLSESKPSDQVPVNAKANTEGDLPPSRSEASIHPAVNVGDVDEDFDPFGVGNRKAEEGQSTAPPCESSGTHLPEHSKEMEDASSTQSEASIRTSVHASDVDEDFDFFAVASRNAEEDQSSAPACISSGTHSTGCSKPNGDASLSLAPLSEANSNIPSPVVNSPILDRYSRIDAQIKQYVQSLEGAGFRLIHQKLSQEYFKQWAKDGITTKQVLALCDYIMISPGTDPVPLLVHQLLYPSNKYQGRSSNVDRKSS